MRKITPVIVFFFIWRVLLFLPLSIGEMVLPYRSGYDYTNIWKFIHEYQPVSNVLLFPWANFDGVYYLSIAGSGYTKDNAGFLPLFPLFIHLVSSFFGVTKTFGAVQFFIAFFIANICFFLSLIFFYKLVRLDYSNKIAIMSIIFFLVFPTSFFFGSIYSESLFLLLSLLSFYFARKKQWILASIFGMLLGITRVVGISIFPALLYEFFQQEKTIKNVRALPLLIIPAGIANYAFFNLSQWGDAFRFLHVHGTLGNSRSIDSVVLFPQTIFRYGKIFTTVSTSQYEWWIAFLEIVTFFVVSFLLYIGWKKGIRFSYILFAVLCFLIPVSSGTFTGLPRYVVILFPIFITLALLEKKIVQAFYIIISIILLFILLLFFSRGYYVA